MYDHIITDLRKAYDRKADERDQKSVSEWKHHERLKFLLLLHEEGKHLLLDVGAGTGVHGRFFQDHGMEVICTDLSYENSRRCREKGLPVCVMDFLGMGFDDDTFEALFVMNSLLHVPKRDLPRVLESLRGKLIVGGLFYWGQYGGIEREGSWSDDHYEPKRYFSLLPDDQLRAFGERYFEIVSYNVIETEPENDIHFHSVILRR